VAASCLDSIWRSLSHRFLATGRASDRDWRSPTAVPIATPSTRCRDPGWRRLSASLYGAAEAGLDHYDSDACLIKQVQLAKRLVETQGFVSKCERGERRIEVMELRMFCQAFGLTLKQFVGALEKAIAKGR
jgi:hypothetical protein